MSDMKQKLFKIISEELDVELEKITSNSHFVEDLGADSLDTVELIMSIEEGLGIEIEDSEAEKFQRVQDVLDFMATAGAED